MDAYKALLAADGIDPASGSAADLSVDRGASGVLDGLPSAGDRAVITPAELSAAVDRIQAAPPGARLYSFQPEQICDACDMPRGRAIREALYRENQTLHEKLAQLQAASGCEAVVSAPAATTPENLDTAPHPADIPGIEPAPETEVEASAEDVVARSAFDIKPGVYPGDPYTDRGDYPRKSHLSVLRDLANEIRVHDADHVEWFVQEMGQCDPDLGGEEQLDKELAPGVEVRQMAAIVPPDDTNCGAFAISNPKYIVGPTKVWMKNRNTAGGFGGLRGRSEWMVPRDCTTDCRVLFVHGGSFMWYSGVDEIYRPLTSRIAAATGMPVLAIDFRLSPEFGCLDAIEDCLDALVWMDSNGPDGPAKARKLFVCGDSSGGGQALAIMLAARDGLGSAERDAARPPTPTLHGCCAICPLADLTYDVRRSPQNSYRTRKWDAASRTGDPVFTDSCGNLLDDMQALRQKSQPYVGSMEEEDMKSQLASPLWAESWEKIPPLMLLSADEDVTLDDAVDIAKSARTAGVEVDLCVWPRMFHCWQCYTEGRDRNGAKTKPFVESVESIRHIGMYFKRLAERQ